MKNKSLQINRLLIIVICYNPLLSFSYTFCKLGLIGNA